jgi:hypothetical protein
MTVKEEHQSLDKRQFIQRVRSDLHRLTGRSYHVDWGALDIGSLRALAQAFDDLEHEQRATQLRPWPWRR